MFKGLENLNIIFSYIKVNKICNLDHPVYQNSLCWFSATCISEHSVFCIITHMGDSILKNLSQLSQNGHLKGFVYNIIIWLHFLFGFKSNMAECFCSYIGFRCFWNNCISDCLNRPIKMRMFITSKNKYLSNDMKIFGTCSIPLTAQPPHKPNNPHFF